MAGYVIASAQITDPTLWAEYSAGAPASVAAHGGRYLIREDAAEVVQGAWAPHRVVVIEFGSVELARAWQNSPDYAELRALLNRASNTSVIIVNEYNPS